MTIREIQAALKAHGFDPGPLDGIYGNRSKQAVRDFQRSRGLRVDAIVGPKTLAALLPELRGIGGLVLTREHIQKISSKARADIVNGMVERQSAIEAAGIVTRVRLCHFLTQICHESAYFTRLEENLSYTEGRLRQVFPKYFPSLSSARACARNPEALANKVYGGRLGNTEPGDGWRYRGGGLIQTTGRTNYRLAGYEENPDDLRCMPGALDAALVYWMSNDCNRFADRGDLTGLRRRINGGTNGLADTKVIFKKVVRVIGL